MNDTVFWQQINNSGLKIRADYTDPTLWVGVIRGMHIGPYHTREEVVITAIRWFITQIEAANGEIEEYQEEKKQESAIEVLSAFMNSIFF